MFQRILDNIRQNLKKPQTAEQKAFRASDQLFSEVMIVGILGALIISTGILYLYYSSKHFDNDFFVFYNVAQRPWLREAIYRFSEADYYMRHETRIYAPYIYAPHFLLTLRFMHGMVWYLAEFLWQWLHVILFFAVCFTAPVRRLGMGLIEGGKPFMAPSLDRWVQLLYVMSMPAILFSDLAAHPTVSAAAALLMGIALLERAPIVSGVLFAYLTYKFQIVLLLPVLLFAGHHWRALKSFCFSVAVLFVLSTWKFGWQVWPDYIRMIQIHAQVMREAHGKEIAQFFVSMYANARLHGVSEPLSLGIQLFCAALGIFGLMRAAQSRNLAAVFIMFATGSLLTTPYAYTYDLVPVGVAAALLVSRAMCLPPDWKMRLILVYLAAAPNLVILFGNQSVPAAPIYVFVVWLIGMHWVNQLPKQALWPRRAAKAYAA